MMMKKALFGTAIAACLIVAPTDSVQAGTWAKEWTLRSTNDILRGSREAQRATRDGVNDLRQELRDSTDRMIAALRGHSGEQSSYQDKQIEATRRIEDAAQQNASQRLREEFRAKAESGEFDPAPDICLLAGLFSGSEGVAPVNLGSNVVAGARSKSGGLDPSVRAGGTQLAASLVAERKRLAGALNRPDPTADSSVLYEYPTIKIDSPQDEEALERLIRNMTDPFPARPVTEDEMRTPEGAARAAARTVFETRASTSQEVLSMVTNMRAEVGASEPILPYVEDIAGYNRPIGEKMSELQQIDIRTLRYYAPSPEMATERATLSDRGLLQTLVDQIAISNRIAYIQLELDTRRAGVETQILSTLMTGL